MFSKFIVFAATSLALSAVAAPSGGGGGGQCNTGPIQCCDELHQPHSKIGSELAAIVGIDIGDITALVGKGCSPITVIGGGNGGRCEQRPVCCENNHINSLISISCSPIDINLL